MENTSEIKHFFEEFLELYEKRKEKEKPHCSMCGKKLNDADIDADHRFSDILGYGSKYDGDRLIIQWCNKCFDEIIDYTARSREYFSRGLGLPTNEKRNMTSGFSGPRIPLAIYWDIIEERTDG